MRSVVMSKLAPLLVLIGNILVCVSLFLCLSLFNKNNALAAQPKSKKERPYTVILDPGHGGEDTGAQGTLGTGKKSRHILEKDIALAIAIRVEHILKDKRYWKPLGKRIEVVFTRRGDKTVALGERSRIAQNVKADLYLSIHSNFETTGTVSGIETYILKNDEASVKKLAEIQAKGALETHGFTKETQDPSVALLLSSVAADSTVDASRQAAELIHKSVLGQLARRQSPKASRGVRQALLYVLLNAQTPAVLFEALYMSNPKDLAFVAAPENRQKIAEGIAMGILRFLALR